MVLKSILLFFEFWA